MPNYRFISLLASVIWLTLLLLATTPLRAASAEQRVFLPVVVHDGATATLPVADPLAALSPAEREAVQLTNRLRRAAGCHDLTVSVALTQAAKTHSADMAARNQVTHQGSDGSWPWDRAEQQGYNGLIGENIAAGYSTSSAVLEGWRASKAHYENIVNCGYGDVGLSVVISSSGTMYWTQTLGKR